MVSSNCVTESIRIRVIPRFLPKQSDPLNNNFLFSYSVTITNESDNKVQLISRNWTIINSDGETERVNGPGVIGHQPEIDPGESYSYDSYCPLNTEFGTMEGSYEMIDSNNRPFIVQIGRFYLATNAPVEV